MLYTCSCEVIIHNQVGLLESLIHVASSDLMVQKDIGDRQIALEGCLKRLSNSERALLRLHYEEGQTYRSIAEKYQYAERKLYTIMSRIHISLHDCILQTLVLWKGQS